VLDNLEQLLPDVATPVAALLAAGSGVRVLATSRARIGVRGERDVAVEPLPVADASGVLAAIVASPAVRLFVERAAAARHGFALTAENASEVAAICARLDGLPLAIELAAAHVRLFSPPRLLARLESRLPLLSGGVRDLPARQRTLRDAIAWSHDLLSVPEQALFARLAVFVGGADLAATEAVCFVDGNLHAFGSVGALLALVDQSLLQVEYEPSREPRFRMLETVREFARERLAEGGEEAAARWAHASYFRELARTIDSSRRGPDQAASLVAMEREIGNVRAALVHALEVGDPDPALELATALGWYWRTRGRHQEACAWLERALTAGKSGGSPAPRAAALWAVGVLLADMGKLPASRTRLEASLALHRTLGDAYGIAGAIVSLGVTAEGLGDLDASRACFEEAVALGRHANDALTTGLALQNLGRTLQVRGDVDAAAAALRGSLTLLREAGYSQGVARSLNSLGRLTQAVGGAGAEALFEESLAMFRSVGYRGGVADGLVCLGWLALDRGDRAVAASRFGEALTIGRDIGAWWGVAPALLGIAGLALSIGHGKLARRLANIAGDLEEVARFRPVGLKDQALVSWLEALGRNRRGQIVAGVDSDVRHATITEAVDFARHMSALAGNRVSDDRDPPEPAFPALTCDGRSVHDRSEPVVPLGPEVGRHRSPRRRLPVSRGRGGRGSRAGRPRRG
jgi:predicted ATPase